MLLLQNLPRFSTIVLDGVSQVFLSEQQLLGILNIDNDRTDSVVHHDEEEEDDDEEGRLASTTSNSSDCQFHLVTITPPQLREQPKSNDNSSSNSKKQHPTTSSSSSHHTTITTGLIFWSSSSSSSSQTPKQNVSIARSKSPSVSCSGHKRREIQQNDVNDDENDDDDIDMELEDDNHHSNTSKIRFRNMSRSSSDENNHDLNDSKIPVVEVIAREYDVLTEELSSNDMYDRCEQNGLLKSIRLGNNPQIMSCLCKYQTFMNHGQTQAEPSSAQPQPRQSTERSSSSSSTKAWYHLTNYISSTLLVKRGLYRGCKIVPSCYEAEDEKDLFNSNHSPPTHPQDGITIKYPPIPCIDDTNSMITMSTIRSHNGTRQFLQQHYPSPTTLTNLFLSSSRDTLSTKIFQKVLKEYYNTKLDQLLGDIQLSYMLFLHLKCYKSFEHWRDLLSMISFVRVSSFADATMQQKSNNSDNVLTLHEFTLFVTHLLLAVTYHIDTMNGDDFLQDIELYSNNFFIPVLQRLVEMANDCLTTTKCQELPLPWHKLYNGLAESLQQLISVSNKTFQLDLSSSSNTRKNKGRMQQEQGQRLEQQQKQTAIVDSTNNNTPIHCTTAIPSPPSSINGSQQSTIKNNEHCHFSAEDDDEDGPVIVPMEDIEDSLQRLNEERNASSSSLSTTLLLNQQRHEEDNTNKYPLLMASMASTNGTEDLFMTCARVLDQQNDVSLVREAASFLEDYERRKF